MGNTIVSKRLTVIIQREADGFVSLCPELDIAEQGNSIEQARTNLRDALDLFFESASPKEIEQKMTSTPDHKTVTITGRRFHYAEHGRGTPLLLAHGFPLDHSMWRGQLEGLSDVCRVIAPDLRGFGASDVTPGTVTMEQMADDLAELLDVLTIKEPIIFCGLSMGGYVAWQFALRHRTRLAKLILCDTRAIADTAEAAAGRRKTAEKVLAEGAGVTADAMLPKLFGPATYTEQTQLVEATRQVMLKTEPEGIAAALRGMAERPDVTSRLGQIDVPALVLCGQHDGISPPDEMRQIAAKMPNARFVEIAAAGHMAPLEQPNAANAPMREFLAQ